MEHLILFPSFTAFISLLSSIMKRKVEYIGSLGLIQTLTKSDLLSYSVMVASRALSWYLRLLHSLGRQKTIILVLTALGLSLFDDTNVVYFISYLALWLSYYFSSCNVTLVVINKLNWSVVAMLWLAPSLADCVWLWGPPDSVKI